MRIMRQWSWAAGSLLVMLGNPASGEPQSPDVPQREDPTGSAESRHEAGTSVDRDLERSGEGDFRLFFVPASDDPLDYPAGPTVVNASAHNPFGSILRFELFIQGSVPFRFVRADVPCVTTGGSGGSIAYVFGSALSNGFREDHLLFRRLAHCPIDQSGCPDGALRFGCGTNVGTVNALDPKYIAEFELFIPPDAEGTFTLAFAEPPTAVFDISSEIIPGLTAEQLVLETGCVPTPCVDAGDCACPYAVQCALTICDNGMCAHVPQTYGDVNLDGIVDMLDIACVLDGFMGTFKNCDFEVSDVADCEANGVIDLRDVLVVLDAYAGVERCSPGCGLPGSP